MAEPPNRVLVIEDDADIRDNLRDILELDGCVVETAATLAEVASRDDWHGFSVILLDWRLPDGDADALLPRLASLAPDARVIISTGKRDLDGAILALRHGAADYILKPISADALRASVRRIIHEKELENRFRTTQRRMQALFECSFDAILFVDDRERTVDANPSAVTLFGRPREELLRSSVRDLMAAKDRPDFDRLWSEFLADGRHAKETRVLGAGGVEIDVEYHAVAHVMPGLHLSVLRDITERKRAEGRIHFQAHLLNVVEQGVVATDLGGRITYWNRYAERQFGWPAGMAVGLDAVELVVELSGRQAARGVWERLRAGERWNGEFVARRRDGSSFPARLDGSPIHDDAGALVGVVGVIADITELRQSQERLLQAGRLAAIGEAMAGLAHESRNALQRSQACLEMLARRIGDRPDASDLIARVQKAQDDLHRLYEEVREYAAPIRVTTRPCRLDDLVRGVWDDLTIARRNRVAELRCVDTADLVCDADPFGLRQVFRNILENALAACSDPVEIEFTARPGILRDRAAVEISVQDNGPGLSSEQRRRLFDPFYTTKTHGTGLGMAIARRVVEAHGGEIRIGDSERPGARIVVTLPRRTADSTP